jgi:hypothetical protein
MAVTSARSRMRSDLPSPMYRAWSPRSDWVVRRITKRSCACEYSVELESRGFIVHSAPCVGSCKGLPGRGRADPRQTGDNNSQPLQSGCDLAQKVERPVRARILRLALSRPQEQKMNSVIVPEGPLDRSPLLVSVRCPRALEYTSYLKSISVSSNSISAPRIPLRQF